MNFSKADIKKLDKCYILLYTVYRTGGEYTLKIIINNSSVQPIYEQIVNQIKAMITDGTLKIDTILPSVRSLAKELKISALTVKKAYDTLEQSGFVVTVHGKGSFVAGANQQILLEEQKKEVEALMETAVRKGRSCSMSDRELKDLFLLVLEE